MSAIPKISELTGLMKTAIEGASSISAKGISVIVDEGLQDDETSDALETKGAVVLVLPVVSTKIRSQSGACVIVDADLVAKLMISPKSNVGNNTNLNVYVAVTDIISAMVKYPRHRGGEFFKCGGTPFALSAFDPGLWIYDLFFTKECVL